MIRKLIASVQTIRYTSVLIGFIRPCFNFFRKHKSKLYIFQWWRRPWGVHSPQGWRLPPVARISTSGPGKHVVCTDHLYTTGNIQLSVYLLALCTAKKKCWKFWNKYSQKRNNGASVPISTFMCLWANYIFPQWVCLFCWRKYVDRYIGIYKSLKDTWMWKSGLRPRNSLKRNI